MLWTACSETPKVQSDVLPFPEWETLFDQPQFKYDNFSKVYQRSTDYVRMVLDAVQPDHTRPIVVDVKFKPYKKGQYGCAKPPWHWDVTPRPWESTERSCTHYLFCVGADCKTQFIDEPVEIDTEKPLDRQLTGASYATVEEQRIYKFHRDNLHRCTKAGKSGWRLFIRVTESEELHNKKFRRKK